MKRQMKRLGISYDWSREIAATARVLQVGPVVLPEIFERGLAYRKKSKVNWCPK